MASNRPFFVILPGGSQNPTHYGYLAHLLQLAGYPTYLSLLPSVGASDKVTTEDDKAYIRNRMILPILEHERHDVIMVMHSYSGVPGSAAALGLGKKERVAQVKMTGVIGQIFFAAILQKGGDGTDIFTASGGSFPPYLRPDSDANLVFCDDRIPPLYPEAPPALADAAAASTMAQGLTSFYSPIPRASWDSDAFKGRVAYIKTGNDTALPSFVQQMMLKNAKGVDWIIKDIESDHSPQLSQPEKFSEMLLELAGEFEEVAYLK
ncbi:alpha/beta-hydrolase [Karstenula rhodostoma CBS 690.94]|uniref:Alpha/beta-hydrolase n=1 Tax=Karstenula rhodostoma CBS 690.94 TaxID=1392251 RepID=A0A9P4U4Q2_9PLEO|nr:alpha/beta-hydrolase [Karstenula rhodostoma CBS 690.94]